MTLVTDFNVDTGEIPSFKLVETDSVYSFLDINPLSKGHALVIPKCTSSFQLAILSCAESEGHPLAFRPRGEAA